MSNYTKTTDFAIKDGLASGNPAKIIKGTEHDTEYSAIAAAIATKADLAAPVFTSPPTGVSNNYFQSWGLKGAVNGANPLTQYDLSADAVILKNSVNDTVVRTPVTTITNNLLLAGPTANGRDQAGTFSANSWVHVYFIWNGSSVATVSSLTAPPTGPTLPGGYTHWCYATALRWNGSSNIVPAFTRSNIIKYSPSIAALTSGVATSETSLPISTLLPPNAITGYYQIRIKAGHSAGAAANVLQIRITSGVSVFDIRQDSQIAGVANYNDMFVELPNINQTLYYLFTQKDGDATQGDISCQGYTLPNGAI